MLRALVAICAGTLIVLVGCSGGEDAGPAPLPTPGYFGIEAVDSAIAAIQSDDPEAILGQLLPTDIDCEEDAPEFSESPSCLEAVNGRLADVFPVTNCDFRYVPIDEAEGKIRDWLEAGSGPEVYGIYPVRSSTFWTRYTPYDGTQYAAVFRTVTIDRVSGWLLVFNDDGFIGFSSGCQQTPDSVVAAWRFSAQLFSQEQRTPTPTLTPLPTLPAPPITGVDSVDAAIKAIQHQDGDALVDLIEMTMVPCVNEKVGLEPDPWCDDVASGTPVGSFPIAYCKGGFVTRDIAESIVESFALEPLEVFSVHTFAGSRLDGGFWGQTDAEFVLVMQRLTGGRVEADALLLSADAIVGQVDSCGAPPEQMIAFWELTETIISPPRPPVTPTAYVRRTPTPLSAPETGIELLDLAIDAIESGDFAVLVDLATVSPTGVPVGGYCHRNYYPSLNALRLALRPLEIQDLEVYALYRTSGSRIEEGFFAAVKPNYALFVRNLSRPGQHVVLVFDDENLVGHTSTCGLPLEDYTLGMELTDPIIPPPQDR